MPFGHLFIQDLHDDPRYFWAVCATVVFSICVHELCHGIVAIWLGDRTPIETGHMTFNPAVHMGMMSFILLMVAGIAWGAMPVNPNRLRGRYGAAWVALAGPVSNLIMAAIGLGGLALLERFDMGGADARMENVRFLLWIFGVVNVELAIFNLIPLPPLDGARVLADFSRGYAEAMANMSRGGSLGVVFLVLFYFAGDFIGPAAGYVAVAFVRAIRGF